MRLWPLIVWFIGDVALMRLTSRYTARIRSFQCPSFSPYSTRKGKKYTALSLSPYNALPRLLLFFRSVQHRASTFIRFVLCTRIPPSRAKFYSFALSILRHSNATPPHPILPQKRRGEESEIGEANDRFLQIFYPWKCIKVLVYLYIPPMYILYIFTLHGRSICTKTVIREEDSLNIKRIFAAINRRVVTIGEGRGIGKGGNITTRSLLFLIVGRWSANKSSSPPLPSPPHFFATIDILNQQGNCS